MVCEYCSVVVVCIDGLCTVVWWWCVLMVCVYYSVVVVCIDGLCTVV